MFEEEWVGGLQPAGYVGVDGPDRPARTCEICDEETDAAMLAPCPAGTATRPHRHVACPVCWRATLALAWSHGRNGAIAWLN